MKVVAGVLSGCMPRFGIGTVRGHSEQFFQTPNECVNLIFEGRGLFVFHCSTSIQIADLIHHLHSPIQKLPELLDKSYVEFFWEAVIDGGDSAVILADKKPAACNLFENRQPARSIGPFRPVFIYVVSCLNDSCHLLRSLSSYLLLIIIGRVGLDTYYRGISHHRGLSVLLPIEIYTDSICDD